MKSITELAKSVGYPMLVFMGTPYVSPELRRLVEAAVEQEREEIIDLVPTYGGSVQLEAAIRARSNT